MATPWRSEEERNEYFESQKVTETSELKNRCPYCNGYVRNIIDLRGNYRSFCIKCYALLTFIGAEYFEKNRKEKQ